MSDKENVNSASRDPEPPGGPASPAPCPECRGSGRVVLLTSSQPCERCGGRGRLAPVPAEEAEEAEEAKQVPAKDGSATTVYTFDEEGRVRQITTPGGRVVEYEYYAYEGPDAGPAGV